LKEGMTFTVSTWLDENQNAPHKLKDHELNLETKKAKKETKKNKGHGK
jgi:hypothetical protein